MRGTPSRMEVQLSHGALWNHHRHLRNQAGREMCRPARRQMSRKPCSKRHRQHRQEQLTHKQQQQTSQCIKPHQVPVPSCRAVVSTPNVLPFPPWRGRFRCLKSRDQEDVQSHAFRQCPVQWSTRKDAQDAGEMVTITKHNANVELPREQSVHLTWEVQHLV